MLNSFLGPLTSNCPSFFWGSHVAPAGILLENIQNDTRLVTLNCQHLVYKKYPCILAQLLLEIQLAPSAAFSFSLSFLLWLSLSLSQFICHSKAELSLFIPVLSFPKLQITHVHLSKLVTGSLFSLILKQRWSSYPKERETTKHPENFSHRNSLLLHLHFSISFHETKICKTGCFPHFYMFCIHWPDIALEYEVTWLLLFALGLRSLLKLRRRVSHLIILSDVDSFICSWLASFVNQKAVLIGLTSEMTTKGFFWSYFSALRCLSQFILVLRFLWISQSYWHCIGSSVCSTNGFMLHFYMTNGSVLQSSEHLHPQ